MYRKSLAAGLTLFSIICVVALVRGQELGRQTRSAPATLSQLTSGEAPTLQRPPQAPTSGSTLADRLRQVRREAVSDYNTQAGSNSAVIGNQHFGQTRTVAAEATLTSDGLQSARRSSQRSTSNQIPTIARRNTSPTPTIRNDNEPEIPAILSGRPSTSPVIRSEPKPLPINRSISSPSAAVSNESVKPIAPATPTAASPTPGLDPASRRIAGLPIRSNTSDSFRAKPISISSRGPDVRVDAVGPGSISIGKASIFQITAVNLGQTAANDVLVAIDLPDHVKINRSDVTSGFVSQGNASQARMIWNVASIPARSQQTLKIEAEPTENAPFEISLEWTIKPLSSVARVDVTQPKLDMTLAGPRELLYGQQASYTISVSNPGTGDAEKVVIQLPEYLGGQTANLGTIAAGKERQFEFKITADKAGPMKVTAVATAEPGLRQEAAQGIVVRRGNLKVDMSGPRFKYAGTTATYSIKVSNPGDAMVAGTVAAIAFPSGVKYLSGINGSEQVSGGLRWDVGNLESGQERVFNVTCQVLEDGQLQVQAGARDNTDLEASDMVVTTVEAVAELTLVVADPKGPKPVGEDVIYKISITNRGTKEARDVNVIASLSQGIDPTAFAGGPGKIEDGQVKFETIKKVEAGQELVLEIKAKAHQAGIHTFRAELGCDNPQTRRVFEGTTQFFGESVVRERTAESPGAGAFKPASSASRIPSSILQH